MEKDSLQIKDNKIVYIILNKKKVNNWQGYIIEVKKNYNIKRVSYIKYVSKMTNANANHSRQWLISRD